MNMTFALEIHSALVNRILHLHKKKAALTSDVCLGPPPSRAFASLAEVEKACVEIDDRIIELEAEIAKLESEVPSPILLALSQKYGVTQIL